MTNLFKEGEVVVSKFDETKLLVIRRHVDRIYYCTTQLNPELKELVFYERELTNPPTPTTITL